MQTMDDNKKLQHKAKEKRKVTSKNGTRISHQITKGNGPDAMVNKLHIKIITFKKHQGSSDEIYILPIEQNKAQS